MKAKTPESRARWAREGLSGLCDRDTQALLLRQLYLGELESEHYVRAREVAEQWVALGTMPDVAHHDAARACQALGDLPGAVEHLEAAISESPPERRTFHRSTLGAILHVGARYDEACRVLESAVAEAGNASALVRAQLALARWSGGIDRDDRELTVAYHELLHDPSGEGYGRFVLGELAFALGDRLAARMHLEAFVGRANRARKAARAALAPELALAERHLDERVRN